MLVVAFLVLLCTRAVEATVEALGVIAAPSSRTLTHELVLAAHPFYLLLKTKLALVHSHSHHHPTQLVSLSCVSHTATSDLTLLAHCEK